MGGFSFLNIKEEKIYVGGIPIIVMEPKGASHDIGTIVLYHGWSSSKETQRIRGLILSAIGYRVAIPDSINHGERNAFTNYGFENADKLWITALNSIDEWPVLIEGLVDKYNINKNKVGLIGNSMGGIISSGIYTYNSYIKALVVLNGSMAWENTNNLVIDMVKELIIDARRGEIEEEYKKIVQDVMEDVDSIPIREKLERVGELEKIGDRVEEMDPIGKINLLKNRPILLLHGDADEVVSIESQRLFYNTIKPKYDKKDKIKFIEYPGLNHLVTTNMMEEAILFFKKYI